jgi:pimeloyl-ACP methyl ester carboxylesterase
LIAIKKVKTAAPTRLRDIARCLPFQTRSITTAGVTISAIVEPGRNLPVVFLHGNSSTKAVWTHQLDLMRRRGRAILAPDLPGHGESENSPTPELTYSFPGYASIVSGLLDALGWGAVDVVGWSLGGHIGLELLAVDSRVRSLLIAGSPPAPPSADSLEQVFYPSDDMRLASKVEFSDADALAYGTAMMGGRDALTMSLLANVKRTDGDARRFLFSSVVGGVGTNQRATVETSDKPLCVLHGECEPFVRLDYLRSLNYRALWNNRIHVIPGAGHAPHWQNPTAFNRILSGFHAFVESRHSTANLPLQSYANSSDSHRTM